MKKERRLPILFLVLILLAVVLLGLERIGVLGGFRAFGEKITVPVREEVYRRWQVVRDLRELGELRERNRQLEEEILALKGMALRSKILEEENWSLRRQLEAALPAEMKFLPAKTIGLVNGKLMIGKGEKDGVKLGMTVVVENLLVGRVEWVTAATSEVILAINRQAKISARTLKTGARGIVMSQIREKTILDKVLQSEQLEKDDLVVTTGEGYIRDLLIGTIGKIDKNEVEPFQKAEVILSLDYGKLEQVFLIRE